MHCIRQCGNNIRDCGVEFQAFICLLPGTLGEGDLKLGPIELKGEQPHTSLEQNGSRTLKLMSIVTNSVPAVPITSHAAKQSLNQMVNVIMRKEGMKEDATSEDTTFFNFLMG